MNRKMDACIRMISDYLEHAGGKKHGFVLALFEIGQSPVEAQIGHTPGVNPQDVSAVLHELSGRVGGQPRSPHGHA